MITRAAQRLDKTGWSRQGLPRPHRRYTAPSKPASAPALAVNQIPRPDYPPYLSHQQKADSSSTKQNSDPLFLNHLGGFLNRSAPYTILPAPLPKDRSSEVNDYWFPDSQTQDLVGVMDACLHNLYDVPRAKSIFDRLRTNSGHPILDSRIYNALLEAYVNMATAKESQNREFWVENAWLLYNDMEARHDKIVPNSTTYAIMLIAHHRFGPYSENPVSTVDSLSVSQLLTRITDRQVSISGVVADRVFTSSEEAASVIRLLSKTAVKLNKPEIVQELGEAEAMGSQFHPDILDNVPEVNPVLKAKVGQ